MNPPGTALLTVGHGALSREAFEGLLTRAGVALLVDVRRFPGSRAHPHFASEAMAGWLPEVGVDYRSEPRLGGRRRLPAGRASEDGWWTVEAFRAYAAHTRTPEFAAGLAQVLVELAHRTPPVDEGTAGQDTAGQDTGGRGTVGAVAVMCSEAVWWRCHRRLVADVVLLAHDRPVLHLMHDGRATPHRASDGARRRGDVLYWDGSSSTGCAEPPAPSRADRAARG